MGKYKSFNLMLEPYCEFCSDFEPEIEKIKITSMDPTQKVLTEIRCERRSECEVIMVMLKGTVNEKSENI